MIILIKILKILALIYGQHMEQNIQEIPFANDDQETLIKKLRMFVDTAQNFKLSATNKNKFLMGVQSMSAAMVSLAAEILTAVEHGRIFVAASLTSQIIEAEIQLLWFDKHKHTNGNDFIDFGYVEQIEMLRVHPDRAKTVLDMLKNNNCQRFLRIPTTDDNELLKRENYKNNWHGDKIKNISKETFDDVLKYVTSHMPHIAEYYNGIDVNYENYQLFCKFKHFAPYMVRKCFATEYSFKEDTPQGTAMSVLVCTLGALLNLSIVLDRNGNHLLNAKPTSTEGLTPRSADDK